MNQNLPPKIISFLKLHHSGSRKSNNHLIYAELLKKGRTPSYYLEHFFEQNRIVKTNGKSSLNSVSSTLRGLEVDGLIRKCGQTKVNKTLYSIYEAVQEIPQIIIEANKIKVEQKNTWLATGLKHNWLSGEEFNKLQEQEIVSYT
jgi:hypothetical protein